MMTKQEILDKVSAHLIAQGKQAYEPTMGSCAYRARDGSKCAAGCLIADEAYSAELECKTVKSEPVGDALEASGVPYEALLLVADLQKIHDNPDSWISGLDALKVKLSLLAERYHLRNPFWEQDR